MKIFILSVIRWILVIPATIFAGWLAWLVVYYLNLWTADGGDFVVKIFAETMGAVAFVGGSVMSGHYVAPRYKLQTSIVIAIVILLVSIISVFLAFRMHEWWSFYAAIISATTCVSAVIAFRKEIQNS